MNNFTKLEANIKNTCKNIAEIKMYELMSMLDQSDANECLLNKASFVEDIDAEDNITLEYLNTVIGEVIEIGYTHITTSSFQVVEKENQLYLIRNKSGAPISIVEHQGEGKSFFCDDIKIHQ